MLTRHLVVLCFLALTISAQDKKVYTATRMETTAPHIDGHLDDPAWQTGAWGGDFVQQVPVESAKPSQETFFKVLYDDVYLYIAIDARDTEPVLISRQTARRDVLAGDVVGIAFDSYHDLRTAYEFTLSAAGAKIDVMHRGNKIFDTSWDAVWDGASAVNDSGWVAEMRVPLSQLRYSKADEQVWGLHVWRWIHRLQEEDQFDLLPMDAPAFTPEFGELHGIRGLKPSRRIEILPYTLARATTSEKVPNDPFHDGSEIQGGVGLDAKIGLSSAFTVDLTVNPDFGQIEADPSVINLSAFETFYQEKRPFFLEGANLFSYEFEGDEIFYSRRVGSTPHFRSSADHGPYARQPDITTILGAVKLTGKTENGLSIGILESLAAEETARVERTDGSRYDLPVEPMTNFLVGRVEKEFDQGRTVVSTMLTAVNRQLDHDHLRALPEQAYTGGIGFTQYTRDRTYFARLNVVGSEIRGSEEAISAIQGNSIHYFQRPDKDYVSLDPTRTRLGGHGGSIEVGRGGNGHWRFAEEFSWQSPGLDFSDAGFMGTPADRLNLESLVAWEMNQETRFFRKYYIGFDHSSEWNYGGELNETFGRLRVNGQLKTFQQFSFSATRSMPHMDMRVLRGGPSLRMPGDWQTSAFLNTDNRKAVVGELSGQYRVADDGRSSNWGLSPGVSARVGALSFSASADYSRNQDDLQYVFRLPQPGEPRYLLGRIDQTTMGLSVRAGYSLTPDLVVQFYGQPFISAGRYDRFKEVNEPRARSYDARFHPLDVAGRFESGAMEMDRDADGLGDYVIGDPNFTFREFRSNLVLRWEYRPGSNLYLVWSQSRSGGDRDGYFDLKDDLSRLYDLFPTNVFAVKLTHWFGVR